MGTKQGPQNELDFYHTSDACVTNRLRRNQSGTAKLRQPTRLGQEENTHAGCSKRLSSKAAAREEARRTLRYVEPLSTARTPLAEFFSILREDAGCLTVPSRVSSPNSVG